MKQKLNSVSSAGTKDDSSNKFMWRSKSATIASTLMLAAGILSSCDSDNDTTSYLQNMERPVIVIAKDSFAAILKGHDGRLFVAKKENWNGGAIINTYNVGDTLR